MGTISEKLTYLNGTKQLLKDKINNLGGSIDEQTTFRQYANQLQNVYDNLPKTEYQEGTEVTLSNCLKGKLDFEEDNGKKVVGIGQSEQYSTQGYQLLNVLDIAEFTDNGVTLSAKDGIIYAKGTPTINFAYTIVADVGITTTGNCTLVRNGSDPTNSTISLGLTIGSTEYNGTNQTSHRDYRTLTATGTVTTLKIRFIKDDVITNFTLKPMLYLGDYDSTKEWEKYTGGQASPNPTYPYPIQCVTGNIEEVVKDSNNNVIATYPISLGSLELHKIGNYQDELVTDRSTGKWYKYSKIGKNNLPTISEIKSGAFWGVTKNYVQIAFADMVRATSQDYNFYSNKFGKANGVPNEYTGYDIYNNFVIIVSDNETTESANTKFANTNVYYRLATPTLTEITDITLINQLEAWYNAHSNNGTTIITSNGDLPMIIKVRALKGE